MKYSLLVIVLSMLFLCSCDQLKGPKGDAGPAGPAALSTATTATTTTPAATVKTYRYTRTPSGLAAGDHYTLTVPELALPGATYVAYAIDATGAKETLPTGTADAWGYHYLLKNDTLLQVVSNTSFAGTQIPPLQKPNGEQMQLQVIVTVVTGTDNVDKAAFFRGGYEIFPLTEK